MKLSENVEVELNEAKASNSRASRMARYSAAAAGVAAVNALDVDAAMIRVVTNVQNVQTYTLNLDGIKSGASFTMSIRSTPASYGSFITKSYSMTALPTTSGGRLTTFKTGSQIGPGDFSSFPSPFGYDYLSSGNEGLFGFRVDQGGSAYTYGWFKVYINSVSSFTLDSYGYNSTLNAAATVGQGSTSSQVPDSGPGIVGLALIGAGAAGVRLLRKLRAGK